MHEKYIFRFLIFLYTLLLFCLTVFSYSQIDLNLTLTGNKTYQFFQNHLIYLGYYNRPLSTLIYGLILFLLFLFYILILRFVREKKLSFSHIQYFITLSIALLFFSYSAFSHDLFNYMFDARIVTKYHANPFVLKALDFPEDLWIRFMHWVHRTYPYGPVWLFITLPFSFLGFEKFVPTLFTFKIMFTLFHIGNIFLIYKILKARLPQHALLGITFYALNPLVLIESLVSPHNEVIMLFFLLASLYFTFIKRHAGFGIIHLLLSAGVKFVTIVVAPLFLWEKFFGKNKESKRKWYLILLFLGFAIIGEMMYREPYPWYFLILIGVASLIPEDKAVRNITIGISIGALLRYAPYLYAGSYPFWVISWQWWLFVLPVTLSVTFVFLEYIKGTLGKIKAKGKHRIKKGID